MGAFDVQEYLREERMALGAPAPGRAGQAPRPPRALQGAGRVLHGPVAGRGGQPGVPVHGGPADHARRQHVPGGAGRDSNECPIARDGLDAEGAAAAGRADEVPLARGVLAGLPYGPVRRYLDEYAGKEIRDDLLRVRALVKVGGIFLVAGAMGLRITRVTVEMRGWWKA